MAHVGALGSFEGGLGGGPEPSSPRGAPAAPRGPLRGKAQPGAVCAGDVSGAELPYGDTASFWRLATKFIPYQKEKQACPFPDLEESLAALSGPRAGFQSGISPSSPSLGRARAGWRVAAGSFGASRRGRSARSCPRVSGLPWASGHRWTSSRSQAGAVQELEARTRCGSAPGPVEEQLERSHLPWHRADGLAGARLGSWEQQPLKSLTLALQAPEPPFSFLFIRKLQRRFLEIYLTFWGCGG